MTRLRPARAALLCCLAACATLVGAAPAVADDAPVAAWSVTPSDAAGASEGRTRWDLQLDPGATAEQHVVVTNSSTVARQFTVYGADAFSTASGGYDLLAAGVPSTDVGSWVSVATPTVDIAPLSTALVAFTVSVPADALPGDHPGGLVVSPVRPEVSADGVVVDTRVAARLNVRVSGEIAPALDVRDVRVRYAPALTPFAPSPATVRFTLVNTGNVKVAAAPRVRVTGPLGVRLGGVDDVPVHEVVPGGEVTVETVLPRVAPAVVATAVVDVRLEAAAGPETEMPLVSTTGSGWTFAVSWTGLAVLVALAAAGWVVVRRARERRRLAESLWDEAVEEARRGLTTAAAGPGAAGASTLHAVAALAVLAVLAGPPAAGALDPAPAPTGALVLTVPPAADPTQPTPGTPVGAPVPGPVPAAVPAPVPASVPAGARPAAAVPGPGGDTPLAGVDPAAAPAVEAEVAEASPAAARMPDLVWSGDRPWGAAQWAIVTFGAGGAGTALAFGARHLHLARRAIGSAA